MNIRTTFRMNREFNVNGSERTERNGSEILARGTLRPFILVTLIHAERRDLIEKEILLYRIIKLFDCKSVILAEEKHDESKGKHYHIGIWANNASKNTMRKKIRDTFHEWEGRAIDISVHKGWGSICKYLLKEDTEPKVWGQYSLQQIKEIANAHQQHREATPKITNTAIMKRLEQLEDWYQVYRDEILREKILTALPRMKEAFEDLKTLREIETNVLERILSYFEKKGEPREYDVEELKEKYLVIDWIACQLCFKRPIKTKQLFIYGEPSTQKTLLINLLSKVLKTYFASARKNDFAGAHDYYDLWAFDEFHEHCEQQAYGGEITGSTAEGTSFVNNLLKVLDGQECRLDSKYAKVLQKKRNVPIIMIANKLPQIMEKHGPFRARFYRIRFSTTIQQLEEERVIATLYGCIVRRALKSPYLLKNTPEEVSLAYNMMNGILLPMEQQKEGLFNKIKKMQNALATVANPIKTKKQNEEVDFLLEQKAIFITREGKVYQLQTQKVEVQTNESILLFEILSLDGREYQNWGKQHDKINLLDFANIPIKKEPLSSLSTSTGVSSVNV
ncbi:hypothetical protein Scep_030023 [Stephania cephalantha]|uniref:Uncharacterized protein n=1 Tax=Stephania cephalantha TaxID=152367 RepID=A0AAP0E3A5_9MAGN